MRYMIVTSIEEIEDAKPEQRDRYKDLISPAQPEKARNIATFVSRETDVNTALLKHGRILNGFRNSLYEPVKDE